MIYTPKRCRKFAAETLLPRHYVFLDSCTDAGRRVVPLLYTDGEGVDRDAIHASTAALAAEFFEAVLN
jgi:hypothetical protein